IARPDTPVQADGPDVTIPRLRDQPERVRVAHVALAATLERRQVRVLRLDQHAQALTGPYDPSRRMPVRLDPHLLHEADAQGHHRGQSTDPKCYNQSRIQASASVSVS